MKTKINKRKSNKTKINKRTSKKNKINKLKGGGYDLNTLKNDFNYYGLLKYVSWDKDRNYALLLNPGEKNSCEEKKCGKCKEKDKCKCITKKDLTTKCIGESRFKTFKVGNIIKHKLFTNIDEDFTIINDTKETCIFSSDNISIRFIILKNTTAYFVLFGYGDDFYCDINNEEDINVLAKLFSLINTKCSDYSLELHLYGHSMGAIMIRYLMHFIDEKLKHTNIIIRLSGIFFTKQKKLTPILKNLDYKSLNLCLKQEKDLSNDTDFDRYIIDRYVNNTNKDGIEYGIEDVLKKDTYIGYFSIGVEEKTVGKKTESKDIVEKLNIINIMDLESSKTTEIKGMFNDTYLHQLDNIHKFISGLGTQIIIPEDPF